MAASGQHFSSEDCKVVLNEILDTLHLEENMSRLDEAREAAGNDMLKTMQLMFPLATQIEMAVIEKYGFSGNGEGLVRFTQLVKSYEKYNLEISQLNERLRAILIPPLPLQPPQQQQIMSSNITTTVPPPTASLPPSTASMPEEAAIVS
ncbi:protein C10-like [Argonauta hians]